MFVEPARLPRALVEHAALSGLDTKRLGVAVTVAPVTAGREEHDAADCEPERAQREYASARGPLRTRRGQGEGRYVHRAEHTVALG